MSLLIDKDAMSRRTFLKGTVAVSMLPLAGHAFAQTDPLSMIKTVQPGKITVATVAAMPMVDTSTPPALKGTDGEIISRIAAKLNLTVEPAIMDWGATVESVRSGRADMVMGNMNWTEKRARVLAVSDPIYYYTAYLGQRKGSIIKGSTMTMKDLESHSLGTVVGSAPQSEMKGMSFLSESKFYDSTDALLRDVLAGRLDFAALDGMEAAYLFRNHPEWDIELVELQPDPAYPLLSSKTPSAFGINPEQLVLFDAINAGIAWLWKTGQIKEILASYGLDSEGFLVPPEANPRLGIDRDAGGKVIGPTAHETTDFSKVFS